MTPDATFEKQAQGVGELCVMAIFDQEPQKKLKEMP